MPRSRPEDHNPRWHLVNLVPVWISQVLTSVAVAGVPFLCFMSCGGPTTPTQKAAVAICVVSVVLIVIEGGLFAFGWLRPLPSLVMQVVKMFVVWAQWAVVALNDTQGQSWSGEQWRMAVGMSVLFTALSMTFSVHFLYAVVGFLRAHLQGRRGRDYKEVGNRTEKEFLILDLEDDRKKSLEDDLKWPLKGTLWPNWILQLMFIPLLCWARAMGLTLSHFGSSTLSIALTYILVAALICPTIRGIWYSLRKDGKRLSLRSYLQVQLFKVGALYFMLDLIVAAHGGWQLQIGSWAQSLFLVFKLSIALGSPCIAEFVFVAALYMKCQQKPTEGPEEVSRKEADDIDAVI